MSLSIIQHGNDLDGSLIFPHSANKPAFFTCSSTQASNYIDFKYLFRIYDDSGEIYSIYKSPSTNLLGVLNPAKIIKSYLEKDFTPSETVDTIIYEKEYRVTVEEYYDGVLTGTEVDFDKSLGGNLIYNQTDSIFPYTIENNRVGDFLVNNEPDLYYKMSLDTQASWMVPINQDTTPFDRVRYYVVYTYSNGLRYTWVYDIPISSTYGFTASDATINDSDESTVKVPIGFGTLKNAIVNRVGFWDSNNNWYDSVAINQDGIDSNIVSSATRDELIIMLSNSGTTVSPQYKYKLSQCDSKNVSLIWENVYGGISFFNFNKIRTDEIGNKRQAYIHNTLEYSSNKLFNDLNKSNTTTYSNEKYYNINLKSDFINKAEIELLKDLWLSEEVYLNIDGVNYPIVAITNSQEIRYKENPEMIQYKFSVQYGKII